jgi:hypothetical protein
LKKERKIKSLIFFFFIGEKLIIKQYIFFCCRFLWRRTIFADLKPFSVRPLTTQHRFQKPGGVMGRLYLVIWPEK